MYALLVEFLLAFSVICCIVLRIMPISKSAKKSHRASLRKKAFNDKRKKTMKEVVKSVKSAIVDQKPEDANKLLPDAYKAIDKAAKRGVIKKNTASRKKSRLSAMIKKVK